ncbi:DUF4157 domain-containing protein [Mucilaginibacter sp. X5P1]|uniref:eCIS core domain-containing protein n=1 Tax=Mucilaginibacter sp. X5P1 TaxID=2723088 RepID=UPI001614C7E0|nr:DUF4157 domain-containing protein [Mucilaginibacter sp. X5P1]MBB6137944.1 hypothetical protein [Mucilaginibacter sp. X5P1]
MGNEKIPGGKQASLAPASNNRTLNGIGYPAVAPFTQTPVNNNSNGLPHQLRQGVEALAGISMADTLVHYNSSAPAQMGALAYAAGNQIHLGPRQEQHLPHEAWHVVQQKQGRVKPTLQAKGLAVNDDQMLEAEADAMGQRAAQLKSADRPLTPVNSPGAPPTDVVQRKIGFEFQAYGCSEVKEGQQKIGTYKGGLFEVETDSGFVDTELEIVTKAVDETDEGFGELIEIMTAITNWVGQLESKKVTDLKDIKMEGFDWATGMPSESRMYITGDHLHFHPQATVGVRFEKIIDLIDYVTRAPFKTGGEVAEADTAGDIAKAPGLEAKEEATGAAATGASGNTKEEIKRDSIEEQAAVFGWSGMAKQREFRQAWRVGYKLAEEIIDAKYPRARGMAAILYSFTMAGEAAYNIKLGPGGHYVKYYMPFLFRNGFRPFFDSLSEDELRELENKIEGDLEPLRHPILPAEEVHEMMGEETTVWDLFSDMRTGGTSNVGPRKDRKGDEKLDLIQIRGALGHGQIGRTMYGEYKKSSGHHPEDWKMSGVDDIGALPGIAERQGAIIELRKLGNDVPTSQLTEFALAVFRFIRLINGDLGAVAPAPGGSIPDSSVALGSTALGTA